MRGTIKEVADILGGELTGGADVDIHKIYSLLIVKKVATVARTKLRQYSPILDGEGGFF